jgi:hypothetical protein
MLNDATAKSYAELRAIRGRVLCQFGAIRTGESGNNVDFGNKTRMACEMSRMAQSFSG